MGFLRKIASAGYHLVGGHLFSTVLKATPASPVIAAVEALGWRFFAGFLLALWLTNDTARAGIDMVVKALLP